MRKLVKLISIGIIILTLGMNYEQKIKDQPKLLWKKTFENTDGISFSMSNNGEIILIITDKYDRKTNKSSYIMNLLNRDGKSLKMNKGKAEDVISGNGKYIKRRYGWWGDTKCQLEVLDKEGKLLWHKAALPSDIQSYAFSADGRYIAVSPSYDSDGNFFWLYKAETGETVWEFGEAKDGVLVYSFISDEKVTIYNGGKLYTYKLPSGKKLWEKVLIKEDSEREDIGMVQLSTSRNGDAVIFYNNYNLNKKFVCSMDKIGEIRWERKNEYGTGQLSRDGTLLALTTKDGFFIVDNTTGDNLLNKVGEQDIFVCGIISNNRLVFLRGFLSEIDANDDERKIVEKIGKKSYTFKKGSIYLLDLGTGRILWQLKLQTTTNTIGVKTQLSGDGKYLAIQDKTTFYLFDSSSLIRVR